MDDQIYVPDFSEKLWTDFFALGNEQRYSAGTVVFEQGGDYNEIIFLRKGIMKHLYVLPSGADRSICYESGPTVFGVHSIYAQVPNSLYTVSVTDLETVVIPGDEARTYMQEHVEVMEEVLKLLLQKIRYLHCHAASIYLSVPQRLGRFLLNMRDYGVCIAEQSCGAPILKHDEIASLIGTTRPRVSQFLNEFKRMGFIETDRSHIRVNDADGLRKYCEIR